ncbi:MAG TPA: ABC transporter substrate-binding protein [Xanthobacteraceae bacterium]|jgi:branched-chain amino acid transport system substrate-binding protein|nr:ABC transporter substrate-binding protein [Xanthobacteraceae bacterium]
MTRHYWPNRRHVLAGAAATAAAVGAPAILRAQGGPLKVGVLLPRSGFEAGIGQDCQRGVDIAPGILKSLGLPELAIMNGDTESNVDTAREHAEKLINDGAQLLIGAFDSGQTTAVAQVAEQKGIPLVINVGSAPEITEQGYKFVVRNFPTVPMLLNDELAEQKDVFDIAGVAPKTAVFMHVNDLFGTGMSKGIHGLMPKYNLPYTILDEISYDPAARDLSVEVTKAKAANAEILLVVGRLNDAMLLTRELVKQRWTPQAILSMGPGWYENQYSKTLGKLSDGPFSLVPWYDPNKKLAKTLGAAFTQTFPDLNMNTNHVFTFEALLIAADAYKRAGSTDPKALADALHATNITDNVSIGPGIMFDAKGQNSGLKCGAVQNRGGKQVTVAPKEAANAKPEWPMKPYQDRA